MRTLAPVQRAGPADPAWRRVAHLACQREPLLARTGQHDGKAKHPNVALVSQQS